MHGLLGGRAAKPYVDWSYGFAIALTALALVVRFLAISLRSKDKMSVPPGADRATGGLGYSGTSPLRSSGAEHGSGPAERDHPDAARQRRSAGRRPSACPGSQAWAALPAAPDWRASSGPLPALSAAPGYVDPAYAADPALTPLGAPVYGDAMTAGTGGYPYPAAPGRQPLYEPEYDGPPRFEGAPRKYVPQDDLSSYPYTTQSRQPGRGDGGPGPLPLGPAPRLGSGPTFRVDTGPMPRLGSAPMPVANSGPMPRLGTGPIPRADSGPMPRTGDAVRMPRPDSGPMPRPGTGPMPRADSGPMPRLVAGPAPRPGTGPMPRIDTGPMPRPDTGPMPRVDTGPMPRLGTGRCPAPTQVRYPGLTPVPCLGSGPVPCPGSTPARCPGSGRVRRTRRTPARLIGPERDRRPGPARARILAPPPDPGRVPTAGPVLVPAPCRVLTQVTGRVPVPCPRRPPAGHAGRMRQTRGTATTPAALEATSGDEPGRGP